MKVKDVKALLLVDPIGMVGAKGGGRSLRGLGGPLIGGVFLGVLYLVRIILDEQLLVGGLILGGLLLGGLRIFRTD